MYSRKQIEYSFFQFTFDKINLLPHESISVFDMFKIGIGPSSSHTSGPWRAAQRFIASLERQHDLSRLTHISVLLYGSLAKHRQGAWDGYSYTTGSGRRRPVTFNVGMIGSTIDAISRDKKILIDGRQQVGFDPATDISFLYSESLPFHPNAMTFYGQLP